jgi:murein DD-endopeptidase MepM/ murein hydrolase activator NlpD
MIRSLRFAGLVGAALVSGCLSREDPAPVIQHSLAPPPTGGVMVASATDGSTVLVRPGDTLNRIAQREGLPLRVLIEANGLVPPYGLKAGQTLRRPDQKTYTVQKGDTFASIAQRQGQEAWALAEANGLKAPYPVHVGQRLIIPAPGGAPKLMVASAAVAPSVPPAKAASKALAVRAEPVRPLHDGPVSAATVSSAPRPTVEAAPLDPPPSAKPAEVAAAKPAVTYLQPPKPPTSLIAARAAEMPVLVSPRAEQEEETSRPMGASRARVLTAEPSAHITPAVAKMPRPSHEPPPRAGRHFAWPVKGKVISSYGPQPGGLHNDGFNIAATHGAQVIAAENGVVAYAGADLKGFGNLLLIKHAGGFVTAYAHNDKLLVKRGDTVKRGQAIATVGESGAVTRPQVHFQVRQGAHAIDPRPLMERSS